MSYEPTKEEIDFVLALGGLTQNSNYPRILIEETLKQTKIFHFLTAIKILRMKDGEDAKLPELDEIKEMLNKILINNNPSTINGNETFSPDLNREH